MLAYIKDRATFITKHYAPARYDMTVQSIYDEVSTIELAGTERNANVGDYIFCGGFHGIITEVYAEKNQLTLTCDDMVKLFARDLFPGTDSATDSIEGFIKRQIEENYINVTDSMYRLPWVEVEAATATPGPLSYDVENGVWNIKSYIAKARRTNHVFTDFIVNGDTLQVRLEHREPPSYNIDLSTADYELLEETYSAELIGRVTALADDTGAVFDWYRLADGTITQTYTAENRTVGKWEKMTVANAADVEQEVRNKFAENSFAHKIEFATKKEFGFYDSVTLRTRRGDVLQSYISAVRKESGDKRTIYKTGDLETLFDMKLNLWINGR